jgi:hypothetical protein
MDARAESERHRDLPMAAAEFSSILVVTASKMCIPK